MPQYVTENIFCSQMSAQHSWHPLYLRYRQRQKAGEALSYTGLLLVMHRQPVLQGIYLPCSEPDWNAAASDVPPRLTLPKGWAGLGESAAAAAPKQYRLGVSPATQAGALPAFILGVSRERLIDLGAFQSA